MSKIWTRQEYECVQVYDLTNGHFHDLGDRITVQVMPESYDRTSLRVIQDRQGQTIGWGWTISERNLTEHFRKV